MNAKKARLKRIYKQGLMNCEERQMVANEHKKERFLKDKKSNKKLKPSFIDIPNKLRKK